MFSPHELEHSDPVTLFRAEHVPRAEALAALVKPCLVMAPGPARGRTRLGGLPDLRDGQAWPTTSSGSAMTCIGQLDLEDLAGTAVRSELPDHGLLAWFYGDDVEGPPELAITWSGRSAVTRASPRAEVALLPEHGVVLRPWWSIPPSGRDCPFVAALGLTDEEHARWGELRDEWDCYDEVDGHRLLGFAGAQGAYLAAALDTDDPLRSRYFARPVSEQARDPFRDADLATRAGAFRLLLEVEELDELGVTWGDGAPTSFLVHEHAWGRHDFNLRSPTSDAVVMCFST